MKKILTIFSHMDWIDWLLVVGFVGAFTWLGIALVDFPFWLAFPLAALVLIGLAKSRRDRMRSNQ